MTTTRHWSVSLSTLALVISVTSGHPVNAQTVPIKGTYIGQVRIIGQQPGTPPLTEFISEATGDSASFLLNAYDAHGFLDFTTGIATGINAFVSDDGAGTLFGTFTQFNLFNADPTKTSTFTGKEIFTDGAGIFDGATGQADFFGTFTQSLDDPLVADFNIAFNGSANLVPEPSAYAVFGIAGLFVGGLIARGRRRSVMSL